MYLPPVVEVEDQAGLVVLQLLILMLEQLLAHLEESVVMDLLQIQLTVTTAMFM